jgi:uncharacterized membrane protein
MDGVFELLFKYRPVVFQQGRLVLASPWPVAVIGLAAALLAVPALRGYLAARVAGRGGDRAVLLALRAVLLLVLLLCLCRPALVVATVVPQQSFVGLLADDSRSMRIADEAGRPRSAVARELVGPESALAERFKLRSFRFAGTAGRLEVASEMAFDGGRTDLAAALAHARQEMQGLPLSGLVLLTDGADNGPGRLSETLLELKAARVPVYAVGLGRERFARDLEVGRVEAPRSVLRGTTVVASVTVSQRGYAGRRARLLVEDSGRLVHEREIVLPDREEPAIVRAQVVADEPGPRLLRVRLAPLPGEVLVENNHQDLLVDVLDRREKLLYFEGETRYEPKFLRRAVAEDRNLQVVTLERTAKDKYLRLDVDDGEELAAGFPRTREELFRYRGLVLGSIEASFFTADQLRMMAEFVSLRGGGLLMLGGRHAFAEGGYAGTPLAEALPVALEAPGAGAEPVLAELKVEATPFGLTHAVTRLAPTEEESAERWRKLPPLTATNAVRRTRPGAATLLLGRPERGEPQVVLATQRYGRGKAAAFAVQDSWLWQMHAEVAVDDLTHETLWRQLLRFVVSGVPGPVSASLSEDRVTPGASVTVRAAVADERHLRLNDAVATAVVEDPAGETTETALEWTVKEDGEYAGSFRADQPGVYEVRVVARRGEVRLGSDRAAVLVADQPVEYQAAEMRRGLLERIAEETGGRFYTPETVSALPEDLSYTGGGATVREHKDLWDMPALYLVMLGLACAEWVYRRQRGLP